MADKQLVLYDVGVAESRQPFKQHVQMTVFCALSVKLWQETTKTLSSCQKMTSSFWHWYFI